MSDQNENHQSDRDPFDGDYIGNIFGWNISMIGLVVMLLLGGLIAYRHITMDVPIGFDDPLESEEEKAKYAPAPNRPDTAKALKPE